MAVALVVQHVPIEDPGRFSQWLPARGVDLRTIHPYAGDVVPSRLDADALIVMGGGMGAYDDEAAPWLPAVRDLLAAAARDAVPTLGVCLGAQLLAVATGGRVGRGVNGPEIGLGEVAVNAPDRLLDAGSLPVVQWHYDTVTELPPGATLLASSEAYPVQAFRVGPSAWGLQFHIEATPELVGKWAELEHRDVAQIVNPLAAADSIVAAAGEAIAARFASLVTGVTDPK
ncbi:MAG TPA: type 1 glutamine amidotransferase [Mycobacteriales bacterium]|nr:type 1 glutamine amidotransferase [Mycobacteriales bacterium]